MELGRPPEQTSRFYVKGALTYLVPILLVTLAKQVLLFTKYGFVAIHWPITENEGVLYTFRAQPSSIHSLIPACLL